MKINPKEIFCELLSGMGMILLIIPIVLLLDIASLDDLMAFLNDKNNFLPLLTGLTILSYVLGILMDAVGLALGYLVIDKLVGGKEPTSNEYRKYWKNVTQELSGFREQQWTYYSCFRNLSINLIPAGGLWFIVLIQQGSTAIAFVVIISTVIIELSLIKSMEILLKLYYQITKYDLSK